MLNKLRDIKACQKSSVALYLDATTFDLVEKARKALSMNRSEFIRYCILHVLDESQALRSRLKEGFVEEGLEAKGGEKCLKTKACPDPDK